MTRYLLIGSGVAAIAAAEAIRTVEPSGSITIITEDPDGYYSRPGLAYLLSGEIKEKLLYPYQSQDYKSLNARFLRGQVTRILATEGAIEVNAASRLPFDRLLVATGARAVPLSVPGATLEGVCKLDHITDARKLISLAKRAQTAVVTGGGITALELAEGLAAQHVKIHYVLRGARYWPNVFDEVESHIIERRLQQEGILLHYNNQIVEIEGEKGRVRGVKLVGGEHIRCDMVAYAIGIAPRMDLAREADILCDRGILVDEFMQTNLPGIFAAGDAAQVYDPAAGRHVLDSLWSPAREQGRTAGLNMAGRKTSYQKLMPFNVTRLTGLTTTIIGTVGSGSDKDLVGIARGDSETWRQTPDAISAQGGFDYNRLRLVIGDKHILGAIVMGDQQFSVPLQTLVREQVDISTIREKLLSPNSSIITVLADFLVEYYHRRNQQSTSSV